MNNNKVKLNIEFGEETEIEANLLIRTINAIIELLNYISSKREYKGVLKINIECKVELKFIVTLVLKVNIIENLINKNDLIIEKEYVDNLIGLLILKKHLNGMEPLNITIKDNYNVIVENEIKSSIIVKRDIYDLYTKESEKSISKIFNNNLSKYLIINNNFNNNKFEINSNEFENMQKLIYINKEQESYYDKHIVTSIFNIKKPDLTGKSQWELTYPLEEKIIKVTIEDKNFIRKVNTAKVSINAKTKIKAVLEIEAFRNKLEIITKKNYKIIKVLEVFGDNPKNSFKIEQISF